MPLLRRCCICGRIAEPQYNAEPYKTNGVACSKCYEEKIVPARKWKMNYGKSKAY